MTNDRYAAIKKKIIEIAQKEKVKLVVAIGSSARTTDAADEYSDLDVIIVTNNADDWLYGELWSAEMSIDAYLKNHLRRIIEIYSYEKKHCDVWHDGRFLDKWADDEIKEKLKGCFAHYDGEDMKKALVCTEKLFAELARKAAGMKGYTYPNAAEEYAEQFLKEDVL